MKNTILKQVLYWGSMGVLIVFARRIIRLGFTPNVLSNDFKVDFLIGVSTAVIIGLLDMKIKENKRNKA